VGIAGNVNLLQVTCLSRLMWFRAQQLYWSAVCTAPCGNDIVQFLAQKQVSVFVDTRHAMKEMRLPIDGEFILNSGAGFYVLEGEDPGCGQGVVTQFKEQESLQWFNPALWQTAATMDGNFLFSVHEESVPCHFDDVVFKTHSSFRVDTSSSRPNIFVKSVTVLGKKFDSRSEFSQYLSSHSGQLQFHGSSVVTVGNPGCTDPSGCDCGNSVMHQEICSTVKCDTLSCTKPLPPVGHCCEVCGAIVTIYYTTGFNLQTYRQRIHHLFLVLPKYKSIQLGMSKVLKSQTLMGIIPFGASPEIQVVILGGDKGTESEALAWDIVKDVHSNQSGNNVGMGVVQMPTVPSMPFLSRSHRDSDIGNLGGPLDHGFDNPMFDKPNMLPDIPALYGTTTSNSISMTQTGVHFINPVYDENETDFNT
uniref:Protein amnionless n=1 Tax=Mastacembelus armatus TaxID=205130 RepID=A0A3Q3N8G7_9TELE